MQNKKEDSAPVNQTGTVDWLLTAQAFKDELQSILQYWMNNAVDREQGGFYGKIGNDNKADKKAAKGSVLNARILWSFSAAYNLLGEEAYLATAERSYTYIKEHFIDTGYGGVYWSVDSRGGALEMKKQIYAIAFTIYGLSEYYKATQLTEALELARQLYYSIEQHSYDKEWGGYLEAFTRDWESLDDLRLSNKDANEKKTMNTHLHVLEAYTNLYRVWPDKGLAGKIKGLLHVFDQYIINPENHHLSLFFEEDWKVKSATVSFGHDIEASWLLLEAVEVLDETKLMAGTKKTAVAISRAAAKGLCSDGSMIYESEPAARHVIKEKHWWVQAEALVGFFNAWQLTGEPHFLIKCTGLWQFIQERIKDHERGEWFWGIDEYGNIMAGEDKAGFWKCPYHNSRACIEMIKRLR